MRSWAAAALLTMLLARSAGAFTGQYLARIDDVDAPFVLGAVYHVKVSLASDGGDYWIGFAGEPFDSLSARAYPANEVVLHRSDSRRRIEPDQAEPSAAAAAALHALGLVVLAKGKGAAEQSIGVRPSPAGTSAVSIRDLRAGTRVEVPTDRILGMRAWNGREWHVVSLPAFFLNPAASWPAAEAPIEESPPKKSLRIASSSQVLGCGVLASAVLGVLATEEDNPKDAEHFTRAAWITLGVSAIASLVLGGD